MASRPVVGRAGNQKAKDAKLSVCGGLGPYDAEVSMKVDEIADIEIKGDNGRGDVREGYWRADMSQEERLRTVVMFTRNAEVYELERTNDQGLPYTMLVVPFNDVLRILRTVEEYMAAGVTA